MDSSSTPSVSTEKKDLPFYTQDEQTKLESEEDYGKRVRNFVNDILIPNYVYLKPDFVKTSVKEGLVEFIIANRKFSSKIANYVWKAFSIDSNLIDIHTLDKEIQDFLDSVKEFNIICIWLFQ